MGTVKRLYHINFGGNTLTRLDLPWGTPGVLIDSGMMEHLHLVLNQAGTATYWMERASEQVSGGRGRSAPVVNPTAFVTLGEGGNSAFGIALRPTVEVGDGFDPPDAPGLPDSRKFRPTGRQGR